MKKKNIICCIDNDKQKQNKRIYGTNCMVLSFEEAQNIYLNNINLVDIILISCPYQEELKKQIIEMYKYLNIIYIMLNFNIMYIIFKYLFTYILK